MGVMTTVWPKEATETAGLPTRETTEEKEGPHSVTPEPPRSQDAHRRQGCIRTEAWKPDLVEQRFASPAQEPDLEEHLVFITYMRI